MEAKKKLIIWVKPFMTNSKKGYLIPLLMGAAQAFTGRKNYSIFELDTGDLTIVKFREDEKSVFEGSLESVKDFISTAMESALIQYVFTSEKTLPEELTDCKKFTIVGLHVTLDRKEFEKVKSDEDMKKYLRLIKYGTRKRRGDKDELPGVSEEERRD